MVDGHRDRWVVGVHVHREPRARTHRAARSKTVDRHHDRRRLGVVVHDDAAVKFRGGQRRKVVDVQRARHRTHKVRDAGPVVVLVPQKRHDIRGLDGVCENTNAARNVHGVEKRAPRNHARNHVSNQPGYRVHVRQREREVRAQRQVGQARGHGRQHIGHRRGQMHRAQKDRIARHAGRPQQHRQTGTQHVDGPRTYEVP